MNDLTIINKMIKELELAKENPEHRQELLTHIRHVKLLSELFLEDEPQSQKLQENSTFHEQEIKAMLGEKASSTKQPKTDHDNANGDSIFDF